MVVLAGGLPRKQEKRVVAWIEANREKLERTWAKAVVGTPINWNEA